MERGHLARIILFYRQGWSCACLRPAMGQAQGSHKGCPYPIQWSFPGGGGRVFQGEPYGGSVANRQAIILRESIQASPVAPVCDGEGQRAHFEDFFQVRQYVLDLVYGLLY